RRCACTKILTSTAIGTPAWAITGRIMRLSAYGANDKTRSAYDGDGAPWLKMYQDNGWHGPFIKMYPGKQLPRLDSVQAYPIDLDSPEPMNFDRKISSIAPYIA